MSAGGGQVITYFFRRQPKDKARIFSLEISDTFSPGRKLGS